MRSRPIGWLLNKIRRRLPALLVMTAAHVGNALLAVAFALGTRQVIDTAVAGDTVRFPRACWQQGAIIVGLLLTLTIFRHLRDRLEAVLDRDWKERLLHVLLRGEFAAVSHYHSGELVNRLNNDVRIVDEAILTTLPGLAAMVTRLIAASIVLVRLEPWFAAVVLAAGAVVICITALLRRRLKGLHKDVSAADGRVSGFLQETMEKLLMVQAMDVAPEVETRADDMLESRYTLQRKRKNVSLLANTAVSILSYGASFAALLWCAVGLLHGRMTFGGLTAVTQLVSQLQGPFVNLSGVIPKYMAMTAAAERLMELDVLENAAEPEALEAEPLYRDMTALCAEHLRFSYDRDEVLRDVSFTLPKGAFAVIHGQSGIGKSTILKLLLGVFRPESGALYVQQGAEKTPMDRRTRRLFAYVPQGNLLLSGTLRENLTIVKPQATEAELQQAIYASAMDEFLPLLPQGLDTPLGENGAGLSEGQAQRLAIARAVLGGAPVLLLDECTSALDAHTEQKVLQRLQELPERTCIAVTHRTAAIALCDWRLEVCDGTVRVHHQENK